MNRFAPLPVLLILTVLPAAAVAQVHKCVTPEAIVYRDTPCAEGQRAFVLAHVKTNARAPQSDATPSLPRVQFARAPAPPVLAASGLGSVLPAPGTPIALGMSDLQVLNLPEWGRPTRITRSKVDGIWREEWLYAKHARGTRHLLEFTNAKLAAIESEPAEPATQQVVHLTRP